MTQLLDLIEDFMDLKELRYARLDGSTKFHERVTEVRTDLHVQCTCTYVHVHMYMYVYV